MAWNIVRITKRWQRHEVSKYCRENGANVLVQHWVVFVGGDAWPHSMWDLSSLLGTEPMSPAVEAQNLNHWTAREVPRFLLFSSLEFGAHSPVVMSGPQCPCISQPIYPKSTDVPICTDGSVSVELIPWEHAHILMDTVINENTLIKTCVLMCVDLCIRTPRKTDTHFYCASQIMLLLFFFFLTK